MTGPDQYASVRYLVDDVQAAVDFYTIHLGFELRTSAGPAFADVVRGPLRLLLSGPASSGARATPRDATGSGRNRIHLTSTIWMPRSTGTGALACRSAVTWFPAPAGVRSCWPTPPAT